MEVDFNKIIVKSFDVSGDLLPDKAFSAKVDFETGETVDGGFNAYLELLYHGETVKSDIRPICKNENGGNSYNAVFTVDVPFNAPCGEYELNFGLVPEEARKCEKTVSLGNMVIGEPTVLPAPVCAEISNAFIPETLQKGKTAKISADISISGNFESPVKPYLSLWKGGLLYGVLESETTPFSGNEKIEFQTVLNDDIPEGEYTAEIGLHGIKSDNNASIIATVMGTDCSRSRYYKPLSHGRYFVKSTGKEHFWYVNQYGALIWDGTPYIPFGGMFVPKYLRQYDFNNPEVNKANFEQDKADLEELKSAGIEDLYIGANIMAVIPTWAYKYFLDYLEESGWKYGIQGDTISKREGSVYYPRATEASGRFAVTGIKKSGEVTLAVKPDFSAAVDYVKNAVYVIINNKTGEMVDSGVTPMSKDDEGNVVMHANIGVCDADNYSVYFTPEVYQDLKTLANYWDEPEKTYDRVDYVFSRMATGDNFRFIVDLLNNECGIYNQIECGRISDDAFNKMFSSWLENKYSSVSKINSAWKSTPEISSFDEAAWLIPVYTSNKDESNNSFTCFVSSRTGKGYKVDTHNGVAWNDYIDARDELYRDYMNKSADCAKKCVDVPVVYKHCSVHRRYFVNKESVGGFDGMGSEAYGSREKVENQYICTTALNNQFARTAWNLITETNNLEDVMGKYNGGQWSYVSKEDMFARFDAALDLGIKGIYDFLLADRPDIGGKLGLAYSWITNKHVIGWASEYKKKLSDPELVKELVSREYKYETFYYYPPNKNWWSNPNERSAVQLTDDTYPFKRLKTAGGHHVLPTEDLEIDTKLLFVCLIDGPYSEIYGPKISEYLKSGNIGKRICVLGHRNDLGKIPEIDKYYTSEKVQIGENETVQILKPSETSVVLRETADGKPWALRDGELFILATDGFETSVGEFGTLKYTDELGISAL